nr:MAG TPA: Transcription elongation factor [Caudoviricetes sp.]
MVDPDEPKVQPKHEFKLGDHVLISKGTEDERTGVIVRLPMDGVDCRTSYVIDLDDKNLGWEATVAVDGIDCKNAWVAGAKNMELLPTTLQANTWYHTTDFTLEELKELLPRGTTIEVEKQVLYDGIETTPPTETQTTTVESVTTSFLTEEPLIETTGETFLKEWFMLQENTTLQEDL